MHRALRHLPNLISSIRILLIVPIVLTLAHHEFTATFWLFGVAACSDAADGYLARRFDWRSELGGILDPAADKLMFATVFVVLALLGDVPVWLTTVVIARDCIIVLGAISYRVWIGPVRAKPSNVSKLNTLIQIVFILAIVGAERLSLPSGSLLSMGALVLVMAVISGIDYVLVYGHQAAQQASLRRAIPRRGQSNRA